MKIPEAERKEMNEFAVSQSTKRNFVSSALAFQGLYFGTGEQVYLLQAAVNLRLAGEYVRADSFFEEILQRFGTSYKVCMEGGLCKLEMNRHDEAYRLFKAAYGHEGTPQAALYCGVALRRANSLRSAISYLETALSLDPANFSAKIESAICYESLEDYPKAIATYESILSTHNISRAFAYNRLGLCYEKIGDKGALSRLLRDESYYASLDTVYSVVSTVLWSLKTNERVNDALLLSSASKLLSDPDRKKMFDPLTLLLSIRMNPSDRFYSGYRKLFMDDEYGTDALRITERYTIDLIDDKLSKREFHEVDIAIDAMCDDIERGIPVSLVRLGDGEGNFLAPTIEESPFLQEQNRKILRNWFGNEARPPEAYKLLSDDFLEAISGADVLGVPNSARIRYEATNEPRGYWGVYFAAYHSCALPEEQKFVSPNVHLHLFRNERFLANVRRSKAINTISCHRGFGSLLRSYFNVANGVDIVVPGEMGSPALPIESRSGEHYPSKYREVKEQIDKFDKGSLVLVAAGVCGKVYSHLAKRAGCFGIDIGAVADYLVGLNTRKIFLSEGFQAEHLKLESRGKEIAS